MAEKLREVFRAWLDNGHVNLADEDTVLLRVRLTQGILYDHGTRYDVDFTRENRPL